MSLYILKPGLQLNDFDFGGKETRIAEVKKPGFTEAQKDELIRRALMSQEGKITLGQAMAIPNLDGAVDRRVIVVDPLPQGSLPEYDRDSEPWAVMMKYNIIEGDE